MTHNGKRDGRAGDLSKRTTNVSESRLEDDSMANDFGHQCLQSLMTPALTTHRQQSERAASLIKESSALMPLHHAIREARSITAERHNMREDPSRCTPAAIRCSSRERQGEYLWRDGRFEPKSVLQMEDLWNLGVDFIPWWKPQCLSSVARHAPPPSKSEHK